MNTDELIALADRLESRKCGAGDCEMCKDFTLAAERIRETLDYKTIVNAVVYNEKGEIIKADVTHDEIIKCFGSWES